MTTAGGASSDVMVSAGAASTGLTAASCSEVAGADGGGEVSTDGAVGGACSGIVSTTGGSTRNVASMGSVGSARWAKLTSGAARQDELLAKDSCAARSSAAAPSPKTRSDIDNMIAANRKRKPGSIDARQSSENF